MMPFRRSCEVIVLATLVLAWGMFAPAQTVTDVAPWKDAKNADDVPDWSRRMLNRLRDLTGTDREESLARNLAALSEIASDSNVVPSTRYNAVLAMGQLDSSPGNPPAAYPAALTRLIEFYQQAESPHYLRYGALLGIVRHALCGIDLSQRDHVIALLVETATAESEPDPSVAAALPVEPAVWDWFRMAALDGLAALKTVGANGNVVSELLAILHRKSLELESWRSSPDLLTQDSWKQICRSIELASKVVKTLGDLQYPPATGSSATDFDAKAMTDSFVRLAQAVCDITCQIASNYIELEKTSPEPIMLMEQLIIHVKMGTHSVVWGMRSGILTSRPGERSFYASLESGDESLKRLDLLMSEIVELSTFLDEGEKSRRTPPTPGTPMPRTFKFDLAELRDALKQCSEALSTIREEEESGDRSQEIE